MSSSAVNFFQINSAWYNLKSRGGLFLLMYSSLDIGKVKLYMVTAYIYLFRSRVQFFSSVQHFRVLLAVGVINIYLENLFYIDINKNIISIFYFNTRRLLFVILLPISCKKNEDTFLISDTFWGTVRGLALGRCNSKSQFVKAFAL